MPGLFCARPACVQVEQPGLHRLQRLVGDVDLLLICKDFSLHPQWVVVVFFSCTQPKSPPEWFSLISRPSQKPMGVSRTLTLTGNLPSNGELATSECIRWSTSLNTSDTWRTASFRWLLAQLAYGFLSPASSHHLKTNPTAPPSAGQERNMICQTIQTARLARNLTLQQVADALGVKNRQQIWEWERGKVRPGSKHLAKLAEVLGLQVTDLLPTTAQLRLGTKRTQT